MTEFIFMTFESISWPAALSIGFILLFLHGVLLTPPSELSLAAIGLYASIHEWLYFPSIFSTTVGNIAGCIVLFKLSRHYSDWITDFLRTTRFKYIKYLNDKARLDFHRYGHHFVFYGRFIPNVRSVVSIPAGLSNMPASTFLVYSGLGCLLWSLLWVSVGYFAGKPLLSIIEAHQNFALAMLILTIIAVIVHRYHIIKTKKYMF
ncbi:DedA family protein [Natronogracilivirga saccharolytica]|uniref:DedA family protein n=1 Tax=Natronogracilivirga saccharolytica TaxID=2812953 RepID=A0A8J7S930_9BACT|nr:DedA family protein [Natronogracilivirga saccharolytica]MBP3192578.1 DedA family protein [Natronogracilivirga saccharolytica]